MMRQVELRGEKIESKKEPRPPFKKDLPMGLYMEFDDPLSFVKEISDGHSDPNRGVADLWVPFHCEGRPCVIRRPPNAGIWCGYVMVKEKHPYYLKTEDELPVLLDVHGGITWAGDRIPGREERKGEWWFGFDCGHYGDIIPRTAYISGSPPFVDGDETYKDREYAAYETAKLARQLNYPSTNLLGT